MASRQFHYTLNRKVRIVIFENLLPENAGTASLKIGPSVLEYSGIGGFAAHSNYRNFNF